jgi:multidrug efflux pump subunit AcrB
VPPQVTLTATYPGKDPEVIETAVAQLDRVELRGFGVFL